MIWLPGFEEVALAHERVVLRTGGDRGTRDAGLIESAVARASAGFGGAEFYPTVQAKAAAIGHGLASNHGFVDGNKRVGVAVMLLILKMNGIRLSFTDDELTRLGLDLAMDKVDVGGAQEWIAAHEA